ncbi:hypothetical protein ANCDUO_03953 [Ancylostoma duodenale]|uniref:Protein arginine methyltransferase NDUFAF7 n=1 Tax=Ancylostoma duodenale TaxID=51022 RepID=A0A0C2H2C9_9BILA|nr:hypothetical protein ANCDUO_03953 [Ancylostoma duodenale]
MVRFCATRFYFFRITVEYSGKEAFVRKNTTKSGVPIFWYKTLADVPEAVYVNIDKGNELCFMNSKGENLHTRLGYYVDVLQELIVYNGGFGIIIDYGHDGSRKDLSFRAYEKHQLVNPLSKPGAIDLTADVNFGYLKSLVVDRAAVFGPNTQREFLAQLGAEIRLRKLLKSCNDREKQEILIKSYNFLMGDMGERFLAMSIFPKTLTGILEKRGGPAGFALPRQSASVENT